MEKNVLAIIQARMNSSRLPGKVLLDIGEKPMLQHVVERAQRAKTISEVVVATSQSKADDAIANFCKKMGIRCYRGSESDVLDRFYQAANSVQPKTVVRLTADCPFIDPEIIDKVVRDFEENDCDYASNINRYTFPEGLDTEAFSFSALKRAWNEAKQSSEREHVTPFIRFSGNFKVRDVLNDNPVRGNHHWSVDKEEDLHYARQIASKFPKGTFFGMRDILKVIETQPELQRTPPLLNEGFYHSLYEEASTGAAPQRNLKITNKYFDRAKKVIPLCAQTFSKSHLQFVQGVSPTFLTRGQGCRVWDADGNEYIDYISGLLSNILGYANEEVNAAVTAQLAKGISFSLPNILEVELAEKLTHIIPCAEKVRFGKNGSDATAGAVRAARAYTGKSRVAVCGYHGWQDWYIGSTTRNAGVPEATRELTHPFAYNDLDSLRTILERYPGEFAAVILEPVNFNEPAPNFLKNLKALTHQHGALLIFDEICSGFIFGLGGAQALYGVVPDLACFGKALGNGFPISCVVGKAEVMGIFEEIFFSFTAGGEAASMAAALKVLDILQTTDALERIENNGKILQQGFNALSKESGLEKWISASGRPQWSLINFRDALGNNSLITRSLFQQETIKRGLLILATHNMTTAHDTVTLQKTFAIYAEVFKTLSVWLNDPKPERFLQGTSIQAVFHVR